MSMAAAEAPSSSSCVRVDPRDFHSAEASAYTARCLEELARSKQYKSYMRHLEYKERLHLTWFLVPLGLISVFYYHLCVFNADFMFPIGELTTAEMGHRAAQAQGLSLVTLFIVLYLLPCTVVAPFTGFFEEPSRRDSLRVYLLLSLVNVAVVSFGGAMTHHPPFLHTAPAIPWRDILAGGGSSGALDVRAALRIVAVRVAPMQGFLLAGYTVARWQRTFWRRVWHIPFPLLSIPLLVGVWGIAHWRVSSLTTPYFFSAEGGSTKAAAYSWRAVWGDPRGVAELWWSIFTEVGAVVSHDAREWVASGGGLPAVLAAPVTCLHAYLAALSLTVAYFAALAVRPLAEFFVEGVCLLLPVDPTVWGLALLSSIAAAVALLRAEEVYAPYVAAPVALAFLLLYNGFVA